MNPEDKKPKDENILAYKLYAENRHDIDKVKENFENFYRDQIRYQAEMRNSMNLVSEQQISLRNRFEQGTALTLKELKKSFDDFRMEWGQKKSEDKVRDDKISDTRTDLEKIDKKVEVNSSLWNRVTIIISCGISGAFLIWAFTKFGG